MGRTACTTMKSTIACSWIWILSVGRSIWDIQWNYQESTCCKVSETISLWLCYICPVISLVVCYCVTHRAKQALLRLGLYHRQKGQFNDAIHWLGNVQSTCTCTPSVVEVVMCLGTFHFSFQRSLSADTSDKWAYMYMYIYVLLCVCGFIHLGYRVGFLSCFFLFVCAIC